MSVDVARGKILPLVENGAYATMVTDDWPTARKLLTDWWDAYKAWERDDTFEDARREQRMSLRWCGRGLDFSFTTVQATRFDAVKDDKGNYPGVTYGNLTSNVGVKGVMARTDPKIFVPSPGGTSRKTELGLHDLSASILRSNATITSQLFNAGSFANKTPAEIREILLKQHNDSKGKPYYVFMPLSKPQDQKLFHLLNDLAKTRRTSELYTLVREFRSKMTRVKLACEHDMGTGFLAVAPDNPVNPKFRYGHQKTTKTRNKLGLLVSNQENTPELITARKSNAMNYDQMLARAKGVNEVTIAYRHHESQKGSGEKFPLAAELVVTKTNQVGFQAFVIKDSGDIDTTSMRFIPNTV